MKEQDPRSIEGTPERAADRGRDLLFGDSFTDLPSLGDPAEVEGLVRAFGMEIVDTRKAYHEGSLSGEQATAKVDEIARKYAGIVYGRGEDYQALPFNSPDQLGRVILDRWNAGSDPDEAAYRMFMAIANTLLDAMIKMEDGKLGDEDARFVIESQIEDATLTLLGLPFESDED